MGELLFVAIQTDVADYLIQGGVGQACLPSVQDKGGCRESVFCIAPHRVYLHQGTKDGLQTHSGWREEKSQAQ